MRALKKDNPKIKDDEPFKGLFTQGMVCHETYKDQNGKWLNPTEVEKNSKGKYQKISDKSEVYVGPSESMSKSKKNVIDPENMINHMVLTLLDGLYSLIAPRKRYSMV